MSRSTQQETMMSRCFLWITERHTGPYKELSDLLSVSTGTYSNYLKDARKNQLYCTQGGTQELEKEERIARLFSLSGELAKTKSLWHLWLKSAGLLFRKLLSEDQIEWPRSEHLTPPEDVAALLDEGIQENSPNYRVFQILELAPADSEFSSEKNDITQFHPFTGSSVAHLKCLYLCGKVLSQVDRDEDAVEAFELIKPYAESLGPFYPQYLVNYANSLVNALCPQKAQREVQHFRETVDTTQHPMETHFINIVEAKARMLMLQETKSDESRKEEDIALAQRLIEFGQDSFRNEGPTWTTMAWSTGLALLSFWCDQEDFATVSSSFEEIEEHIIAQIAAHSDAYDQTDLIYAKLDIARAYLAQGCLDEDLPDIQEMLQNTQYQGAKRLYRNIRRFAARHGQLQ